MEAVIEWAPEQSRRWHVADSGSLERLAALLGFRVLACGQTAVPDYCARHDCEEDGRWPEEADRSDDGEPVNGEDGIESTGTDVPIVYYSH